MEEVMEEVVEEVMEVEMVASSKLLDYKRDILFYV
jgi:hypothetical protein